MPFLSITEAISCFTFKSRRDCADKLFLWDISEQIQSIEKKTLHNVFVEITKRLNFCISLEGNTFEQYL